jgi:hypothetical protein
MTGFSGTRVFVSRSAVPAATSAGNIWPGLQARRVHLAGWGVPELSPVVATASVPGRPVESS